MTGIRFFQTDRNLASARLRNLIPMAALRKLGYTEGNDILVLSKDNWEWTDAIRAAYRRVIFDICDDWFNHPSKGSHYHLACAKADLITCNSQPMQSRIKEETGRDAVVIDDPYEDPDLPAGCGDGLCWFGHAINIPDLYAALDHIGSHRLTIVSNFKSKVCIPWSPEAQAEAINRCRAVFLPTGTRTCKSANRAITAIRRGRFVVAGDIPSYREIPGIWVGDLKEGIDWAMSNDPTDRINLAKTYVNDRFSPEKVGAAWDKAIKALS